MDTSTFEPDLYLERLGHAADVALTEDGLRRLHRAQALAIPFENFDILLGRGISLEPAHVFDKLVRRTRGGYCFELNGLLLSALTAFGFAARPLLARVHRSGTPTGRGHMLLLATLAGRDWIADVGFGGPGLRAPMPFELDREAVQDGQRFRLVDAGAFGTMLQTLQDGAWQDLYSFDLGQVFPADIAYGNHYTSTHPDSFFTFSRIAALPRPDGRITLLDRNLRIAAGGTQREQTLAEGQAYLDALRAHFGIVLDAPYEAIRAPGDRV